MAESRAVEAIEVATLASVEERSSRATVQAGTLTPARGGTMLEYTITWPLTGQTTARPTLAYT